MLEHTDTLVRGRRAASGPGPMGTGPTGTGPTGTGTAPVVARHVIVEVPPALPAPDWYPDPISADHHRWWSGVAWTGYTQPVIPAPPAAVEPPHVGPTAMPGHARGRRALPLDDDAEVEPLTADGTAASAQHGSEPGSDPVADRASDPDPDLQPQRAPAPARVAPSAAELAIASLAPDPAVIPIRTAASAVAVHRYVPPPPASNTPGRVAVGLAITGIIAGVGVVIWPILLPVSVLLLVVAIVTAVAALPRWGRRRGVAVAGLVLGVLGLAVAPALIGQPALQRILAGDLTPLGIDASLVGDRSASMGELIVLGDGIAVTVQGVDCGATNTIAAAGATLTAAGEYCVVRASIRNGGELPVIVRAEDVAVSIGDGAIQASGAASDLGGAVSPTSVDPASGIEATFVVDVPIGSTAEAVVVDAEWLNGPPVRIPIGG